MAKNETNSAVIKQAMELVSNFVFGEFDSSDCKIICAELKEISGMFIEKPDSQTIAVNDYAKVQEMLSKLNEKEQIRKKKGVYYTPNDVVHFIVLSVAKEAIGLLSPENIAKDISSDVINDGTFLHKTVFDPTCGAGEFLLEALNLKIRCLQNTQHVFQKENIASLAATVFGNDINKDSIIISKIRIFLSILNTFGAELCIGLADIINANFTSYDFVARENNNQWNFDIILGNPPYVEDNKCDLKLKIKFGNIYANVLYNAEKMLNEFGCIGFIVPLSYISTSRMKLLREFLLSKIQKQYILSYSDRPDCLFDSVHQKLCILIGQKNASKETIFTNSYQYWYDSERSSLFSRTSVVKNPYRTEDGIPKLGSETEKNIYSKITNGSNLVSVYSESRIGSESVFLNRRETFWMKAYRNFVDDPEYKVFSFETSAQADFCYCLINSSLFWWYWVCTSDCWHVSKSLNGFLMPSNINYDPFVALAKELQQKLENTKKYVGTKQTLYEYKHKECLNEIQKIDDAVNSLYGLTSEESSFVKNYALRYRTSGGVK